MYNHVTRPIEFFSEEGCLKEPGWATEMLWDYDKSKMAAPRNKLKEWDYYLVANEDYGVSFSTAFVGTYSRMTVNLLNYKENWFIRKNSIFEGDICQPKDDKGTVYFRNETDEGMYIRKPAKHYIKIHQENFMDGKPYDVDITLDVTQDNKIVVATPFSEGENFFFYNLKHNCLRPTGTCMIGDIKYGFTPDRSFGVLDLGRGVWPDHNRWYWGSGSGEIKGKSFGFNLGYGFGDLSHATENVIFYDGRANKFDGIVFNIPEEDRMKPWTIVSNDDRFVMDFVPKFDRGSEISLPGGGSSQHQVFGYYFGRAVLDDGKVIDVKNFFGFAEDVINNWE